MFENPRRGRQARNFTTNVPKILDLKSSSEQIFSRKLSLGAPEMLRCKLRSLHVLPPPRATNSVHVAKSTSDVYFLQNENLLREKVVIRATVSTATQRCCSTSCAKAVLIQSQLHL